MGKKKHSVSEFFRRLHIIDSRMSDEMAMWGRFEYETKRQRHDMIKRLCKRQLENFNRDD